MLTHPEIRLRSERQKASRRQEDITELHDIFVIAVAEPGIVILLTHVTIIGHHGIGGFSILIVNPLVER